MIPDPDWQAVAGCLRDLGVHLRNHLLRCRKEEPSSAATKVAAVTSADTIYGLDHWSEKALLAWFESHWPTEWPAEIIVEGLNEGKRTCFPGDTPADSVCLRLLIDPVDGTRGLMYDKRSAWFLAGAAPVTGTESRLSQMAASVMVELPTSRQWRSDVLTAWRDPASRWRHRFTTENTKTEQTHPLKLAPSRATDLQHGFASFSKFFPAGKCELARIEERFLEKHLAAFTPAERLVFDDQYICTGGQWHALLSGQDRFIADLRPLVSAKAGGAALLCSHPYDLAGLPVMEAGGILIEDPWGNPVDAPMDTTTPVAWVGYANRTLARKLRPLLRETLLECGYELTGRPRTRRHSA